MRDDTEKVFILTDSCMWEANKQAGTKSEHTIQVIDEETGQCRYMPTGTRIKFVSGNISVPFDQDSYNQEQSPTNPSKEELTNNNKEI